MTIAYLLLLAAILGLTSLPLIRGKRDRVAVAFLIMGLATSHWIFSIFYIYHHMDNEWAIRYSFLGPLFTAASVFFISIYYPLRLPDRVLRYIGVTFLPILVGLAIPTRLIVHSMEGVKVTYGPGHGIYGIVILYFFVASLIVFGVNLIRARGLDRLRLLYLLLGVGLTGLGAMTSNLFLPALGVIEFRFYGPFFTLFLVGSLAYGMLRHRLMDIQIVIKKGFFYAFLISTISTIFSALVLVSGPIFNAVFGFGDVVSTVVAASIIVLVYPRLRDFFDAVTDRIFYRKKYDYQYTLRDFSQSLSTMIDLDEIISALVKTVPETMKIGEAAFYLIGNDERMERRASSGSALFPETVDVAQIQTMLGELRYLFRNDMEGLPAFKARLKDILPLFPHFEIVFPVRINGTLFGVYVLGSKLSEEVYSNEDISLLETIVHQANTAIQNATHYRELQKNITDLSTLNEFALLINQGFDLDQIVLKIQDVYASLFGFQGITLFLINLERNGFWDFTESGAVMTPGRRPIYKAEVERLNHLFSSAQSLLNFHSVIDSGCVASGFVDWVVRQFGTASEVSLIPFLNGQKLVGFGIGPVNVRVAQNNWMLMSTLSQEAASALDNALLYNQVLSMKNYSEDILQNMSNAVIMADSDLVISGMNKMAEELLRQNRSKMVGSSVSELLAFCPQFSVIEKSKSTQKGYSLEARLMHESESTPISISTGLLRGNDQEILGIICIISDLTLIKELQGQVEQANRLSSLGTMAAGIAHEIKNPLVSIKAFSQMLPAYWDDDTFRTKYQTIVIPQIDRINELCFSLLRLGKPQRPQLGIHPLSEIIDRVIELLDSERKAKRTKISREFEMPDRIMCDPAQIEQVFFNLILNALQALSEPGKGELKVSIAKAPGGYIKAMVQDNGDGISELGVSRLFDPFYSTKKGGTGLGLSIVYKIVDEHRGRILVDSKLGVGTTFTIYLPTDTADPDYFFETVERFN